MHTVRKTKVSMSLQWRDPGWSLVWDKEECLSVLPQLWWELRRSQLGRISPWAQQEEGRQDSAHPRLLGDVDISSFKTNHEFLVKASASVKTRPVCNNTVCLFHCSFLSI